jgi:flagellin-like protein
MNHRKFRKSRKALSPVIASIILIAVTVAVSVVVAAWMGGISLGFMNNAEQITLSNPQFTATTVTINDRNSGASSVTIASGTIDGVNGNVAAVDPGTLTIAKSTDVTLQLNGDFAQGAQYQIQLVTSKGTTIVYTASYQ